MSSHLIELNADVFVCSEDSYLYHGHDDQLHTTQFAQDSTERDEDGGRREVWRQQPDVHRYR